MFSVQKLTQHLWSTQVLCTSEVNRMNTATKVVLVLGTLFLIGGVAMFAVGVGSVSNLEEADFPFAVSYTHLTLPTKRIV